MLPLLLSLGPGAVLVWLFVVWRRRRRFLRLIEDSACALCHQPFSDAIADYRGRVGARELVRLDRFQARFAAYLVECGDCGAINICTRDGRAFRAFVPEE